VKSVIERSLSPRRVARFSRGPRPSRTVHHDQVMVSGRDIGPTILEPLAVNRRLHGNWTSLLKDVGDEIVSARADMNDDADRGGDVGSEGITERSDRADRSRRTANCNNAPLASVHISLRAKGSGQSEPETSASGKLDSASLNRRLGWRICS
jgi:hypothetical protein